MTVKRPKTFVSWVQGSGFDMTVGAGFQSEILENYCPLVFIPLFYLLFLNLSYLVNAL